MKVSLKRKIPKDVKDVLEKILLDNVNHISYEEGDTYLLKLIDKEPESDFYFKINKIYNSGSVITVDYTCKPYYESQMIDMHAGCKIADLQKLLDKWVNLVIDYQKPSIFDDLILETYRKDFYDSFISFKLVDTNSEVEPFNLQQQLALNAYFEVVEKVVEENKNGFEEREYCEMKSFIEEAKSNIGKRTKSQIMKSVSGIWARAQKTNIALLGKLVSSFVEGFGKTAGGAVASAATELGKKYLPLIIDNGFNVLFGG